MACGVTYLRSKVGRQKNQKQVEAQIFMQKVYEAERPEVFLINSASCCSNNDKVISVKILLDVPTGLTLVVTSSGKIIGYTIGNDMSSRSIEGENPLYLPTGKNL